MINWAQSVKKPLLFCLFAWMVVFALPWTREQALLDWRGATLEQFCGDYPAWAPLDSPYRPEKDDYVEFMTTSYDDSSGGGTPQSVMVNGLRVAPQFAAMARNLTDRDVLVWCALSSPIPHEVTHNLVILEQRFPGDAAVLAWTCGAQAEALSMGTRGFGPLSSPGWSVRPLPLSTIKLTNAMRPRWDAIGVKARLGQKFEPANGFWWWLETIALLGARRDEAVWPVLRVGSSKTVFDDHSIDRLLALRRAHLQTLGEVPSVSYLENKADLFASYGRWLDVTQQVCENVMGARLAGHHKTALEGGRDLVMMGRLLRRSSRSIWGWVGIGVESMAMKNTLSSAASSLRLLTSLPNAGVLAAQPGSLLRYANELKRKDIAYQLVTESNALVKARSAHKARTNAARASSSSQTEGISNVTTSLAAGSQNTGALLVRTLPIPLAAFALLSLLSLIRRREEPFALPAWTRGLCWSALALLVLVAVQTLLSHLLWQFIDAATGWTPSWGFDFIVPRLMTVLPLWVFAFAAGVACVGAAWAIVMTARRARGDTSLMAQLRCMFNSPDERTGALNLGPLLQLIALVGIWGAFIVALGAWFFLPQNSALKAQSLGTLYEGLALMLFGLAAIIPAFVFRAKQWGWGTYFRAWAQVTQRFLVAHLVLTTVLYLLLAMNGAYWSARFDNEWLRVNAPQTVSSKP